MRSVSLSLLLLTIGCSSIPVEEKSGSWKNTGASVHEALARTSLRAGRLHDAEASSREALRVDSSRTGAMWLLGRTLLARGAAVEAEMHARQFVSIRPEDSRGWILQAESLLAQGREAEALQAYEKATELGSTDARLAWGGLLLERGDEVGASLVLGGTEEGQDVSYQTLSVLVTHYRINGRLDEAAAALGRARAMAPRNDRLLLTEKELCLDRGMAGAVANSILAVRQTGREPSVEERLLAAAALLRAKKGAQAADEYRRLVRVMPEEPSIRVALGEALLVKGDADGAEAAFVAAGRLDPELRLAHVGIARARMSLGRYDLAIDALEEALSIDSDHAPTRSLLVLAWAMEGDIDRARGEAVEVSISDPGGRFDLACRRVVERFDSGSSDGGKGKK